MGDTKLYLLLLLSSYALAQQGNINDEQTSTCLLASRYKAFKKYVYQYTTESQNKVDGAALNGAKISCQVEVEVPQTCRFILHTRSCALGESSNMDAQGQPVYTPAASSDAFAAAMQRNPLKFTVEKVLRVLLYPEQDEPVNILNIKRGIISALMVPVEEEEQNTYMATVHGVCETDYRVNARKDIATDVSLSRELSNCDQFYGRLQDTSPLALTYKLHRPMSKLIRSSQNCNYQFDNRRKHMTVAGCTETHDYLPSSEGKKGLSSVVTQTLTLKDSPKINNRYFEVDPRRSGLLYFKRAEDKAPVQTKDAVISTLKDLKALGDTGQGWRRAGLFHKLVSELRALRNETLSRAAPEMLDLSAALTWQALFQCGTAECTSAILHACTTVPELSLVMDALVYGLSLQANVDAARVRDMLSAAQFKQSKAIMYALANTVTAFHRQSSPEITAVSKFMETLLEDCSTDPEVSFLALRVVGVMGRVVQKAGTGLIPKILRCAKNDAAPQSNQKAAIQSFRRMEINDEIKGVLLEVYRNTQSPVENRVAAYLILIKSPDQALISELVNSLEDAKESQLNKFVFSHLYNIHNSNDPELRRVREYISTRVRYPPSATDMGFIGASRNYKMDTPIGLVKSNVIFDGIDTLPKEVMLETTLRVLDYSQDIFEIGIEGKGFQPTIDALFGERGFFPEAVSRALYNSGMDKVPEVLQQILDRIAPNRSRMKRQLPRELILDIQNMVKSLVDNVASSPAPEATAYLRLLGREVGYMKTSEMKQVVETLLTVYQTFFKELPAKALSALASSNENDLFAHYILMESVYSFPTASGLPLKLSLAGVLAPGARGGIRFSPGTLLSFMPSVGFELITQMAVHLPDYVAMGLEMHVNMHHETSFNAKVTVDRNHIKLSIPGPKSNTELLSVRVKTLSVSSGRTTTVPRAIDYRNDFTNCQPLFPGLKSCILLHYTNSSSTVQTPSASPIDETRFAIEIQPTGEVSEYAASIKRESLFEGRNRVESLKLSLKAEGIESKEATATLKFNPNRNIWTTEVRIPDYDVETGIKLAVSDVNARGKTTKAVTIDVTNKNVPQLTLVGRIRLERMETDKEMFTLDVQTVAPTLKADASLTLTILKDENAVVMMSVEHAMNLPETTSLQKVTLKYDNDKFEVEMNSDVNSEIQNMIPNVENYHRQLQQLIDELLDQRVAKTDMKLRHIVAKGIEAGNIWLDKLSVRFPSIEKLRSRRSLSDLTLPSLPERLFLQSDSLFRYQFNKDRMAIPFQIPLPLGGKSSEELRVPATLSFPSIHLPTIGIRTPAKHIPVPAFSIPRSLDFTVPLLGLFEASSKINSNIYNWEGAISGGNNTVDVPSYIAHFKVMAQSPFSPLSYKIEGTGMMSGNVQENLKYLMNGSLSHSLIDASFSISEALSMKDSVNARANYKLIVSSPLGLQSTLDYSAKSTSFSDTVTGDGTLDGSLKLGPMHSSATYAHSYTLRPLTREGSGESSLSINSPLIQVNNAIDGVYSNNELKIMSKTNTHNGALKHVAELKYKDAQVTLKSNAVAMALGKSLNQRVELGLSSQMVIFTIESQADDPTNRAFSLITVSLDSNGLEVNSEGSLTSDVARTLHKASLTANRNGLTTSGTHNIQCSPVTFESVFNGNIDASGASLSSVSKATAEDARAELNIEGKLTTAEASVNGVLGGFVHDMSTRNTVNVLLNQRALTISSDCMGSLKEMKTETSHTLALTLWTAALRSKTNNVIREDVYYKHDVRVDMKPFVTSIDVTNDAKLYGLNFNNEGHVKLEPNKVDLAGGLKGGYGERQHINHKYEITYADMAGSMKSVAYGTIMDTLLSHDCQMEFAGLASKTSCEAKAHSEYLRFDGSVRTVALPFSFTLNSLVSSDGKMNLYGKHTGQIFSKLLVNAEPAALAYAHDCRASSEHVIEGQVSSAHIDNKLNGLLTPSKQSLNWESESKLNGHTYNQNISTYNNDEKTGIEFSGILVTDLFSKLKVIRGKRSQPEIQEIRASGFVKYDKKSDCHIIQIPFINSFHDAFEVVKVALVNALQTLHQYIDGLDVHLFFRKCKNSLDRIPRTVNEMIKQMDLESKVKEIKEHVSYLATDFSVTMEDLEVAVENLKNGFEKTVMEIATEIQNLILTIKDFVARGDFSDSILHFLSMLVDFMQDVIGQIDLSSLGWLQDLDSKYNILESIKATMSQLKQAIQTFDLKRFSQDVRDYILSLDLTKYIQQLSDRIPSAEIATVIESMKDIVVNWIDEYEIPDKLNAVYFYIRDLLVKYDLDEKFKGLLDKLVVLIKDFKIEQTVQKAVENLSAINLKMQYMYNEMMQHLGSVTTKLKAIDFKQSIGELNQRISSTLTSMKEFDYNSFVDESNKKIVELINYINEQIKTYGIVDKIEAVREFLREIQSSVIKYIEKLKSTKVCEIAKKLYNVIDTTAYNDIKMKVQEILEDIRQRILGMDIRHEMYTYLQRMSESYTNMIAFISVQFSQLIQEIRMETKHSIIMDHIEEAVLGLLDALKAAEIEISSFTVPLTDLVIPAFKINMNKLQEISIPAKMSVPEFTIIGTYTIPAFTIDFQQIKANIIAIIDRIREYKIPMFEPEEIFGDLKVLYLINLPDLTFPEIKLSEIKFPVIKIPKLNLEDFKMTMLPIPEIEVPEVPNEVCLPLFGKLYGEFRLESPSYTLITAGVIQNSTTTFKSPEFTASFTSTGKSHVDVLDYALAATAHVVAPRMKKLIFKETFEATHVGFSIDHEGSITLTGPSAEASVTTAAMVKTKMYTCNLENKGTLTLKNGVSASMDTTYNHSLNIPIADCSSQTSMTQNIVAKMENGKVSLNAKNIGNGKWSIQDYSDEGTHKSDVEFTVDFATAKLMFESDTNSEAVKMKQILAAESLLLNHITVDARAEAQLPFLKSSVMTLKGEAHVGDLKVALTATHDAELVGMLSGSVFNSFEFMAHPFEVVFNCRNKGNSKMTLPLKLNGKADVQHDFGLTLNSEKQRLYWAALARFNQYKYNHNMTIENNVREVFLHALANGQANVDFLTLPLSVPEMTVPYFQIKTAEVKELSLWEHAGLRTLLTTPQQTFDMNLKLHYFKNPQMHSFNLDLEPIYIAIGHNALTLRNQFEECRDKMVAFLKDSYIQAKKQYAKHSIDTSSQPPQIFRVPGYKLPLLNIEVSAFRAELPAIGYFVPKEVSSPSFKVPAIGFSVPSYTLVLPSLELPVIYLPETLSQLTLPTFKVPAIRNQIWIPAMGNLSCDLSFKSSVITLNANADLSNQSDLVARFAASSTSVFDIFNGKLDGTTSLTSKRGIKLATTMSAEHQNLKANHDCTVSLTKRSVETSVANIVKLNTPFLNLDLNQEFLGNTKTKPNVASKMKLNYTYNIPLVNGSVGRCSIDHELLLEALTSHVSLQTSTIGKTDMSLMYSYQGAGDLENTANFYLNANGLRSTVKFLLNSHIDHQPQRQKRNTDNNVFRFDMDKNVALEVSLRRLYASMDYTSNNNANFPFVYTRGKHSAKGTLDFVPLTTLKATADIDAGQSWGSSRVALLQNVNLAIATEKQSLTWRGREEMGSTTHAFDLHITNDEAEVRMDISGSVEAYLAFLKSAKLPVYQKSLWDVLKFDRVTNLGKQQFLNMSSSIVYTKGLDGIQFSIPSKVFEDGITFTIPELTLAVPRWVKNVPHTVRKTDKRMENIDFSGRFTRPPMISVPAFDVPFTTLQVEPFTIDLKNLNVPKTITTTAFEIMLPGLPKVAIPSYNIDTEFLKDKMSFLWIKIPQYEITVASFQLPKSLSIGHHTIDLDEITNQISNFEIPAITIPEQKMEIPEIDLYLPTSVFIPVFGALAATWKVSSPIYKVTTTAKVENKDSSLVATAKSVCSSTMMFLEYDLDATATLGFDNGVINLNGMCNFIHSDVNVAWQHILTQHVRMKRQTSSATAMASRHTLNVDITSPTFVDVSVRFASRKDGITASVSSPSSGFLGLYLQRKSPSQLYGKFYSRYLSNPGKDVDILTAKASLRNSEKLSMQTTWNLDVLHDFIEGAKDRTPAMTEATLKFINKYHTSHFGFDLHRGGMKWKNSVSSVIELLSNQATDIYGNATDNLMFVNELVTDGISNKAKQFIKRIEHTMDVVLDPIVKFLSNAKFSLPGSNKKLTGLEIYRQASRSVSMSVDRAIERIARLIEAIWETASSSIKGIEFSISGTNVVVRGQEILEKLMSAWNFLLKQRAQAVQVCQSMSLKKVFENLSDALQMCIIKAKELIVFLRAENPDIASQMDGIYAEGKNTWKSSKQHIEEAKKHIAQYKDLAKRRVQEVYNVVTNSSYVSSILEDLISVFQSHLYGGLNESIDLFKNAAQNMTYISVSNKKMDVDIPLPFFWKSFTEWPTQFRQ